MKNKSFLLLLTLCWASCKLSSDDTPIDELDPPYFSITYQVDNQAGKAVVAGVDNIYLYTDYSIAGDDVITCTGTFSPVQCLADSCADRLHFEFRNNQIGSVVLTGSTFHAGTYAFTHNDSTGLQLGTVALEWTDANGQLWRSRQGSQTGSVFEVIEAQPYELNEQGQNTWQLQVNYVCRLYNDSGADLVFSGKGRLAVAYP